MAVQARGAEKPSSTSAGCPSISLTPSSASSGSRLCSRRPAGLGGSGSPAPFRSAGHRGDGGRALVVAPVVPDLRDGTAGPGATAAGGRRSTLVVRPIRGPAPGGCRRSWPPGRSGSGWDRCSGCPGGRPPRSRPRRHCDGPPPAAGRPRSGRSPRPERRRSRRSPITSGRRDARPPPEAPTGRPLLGATSRPAVGARGTRPVRAGRAARGVASRRWSTTGGQHRRGPRQPPGRAARRPGRARLVRESPEDPCSRPRELSRPGGGAELGDYEAKGPGGSEAKGPGGSEAKGPGVTPLSPGPAPVARPKASRRKA